MIMKILNELGWKMDEHNEKFNNELEIWRRNKQSWKIQ